MSDQLRYAFISPTFPGGWIQRNREQKWVAIASGSLQWRMHIKDTCVPPCDSFLISVDALLQSRQKLFICRIILVRGPILLWQNVSE